MIPTLSSPRIQSYSTLDSTFNLEILCILIPFGFPLPLKLIKLEFHNFPPQK